jgi:hypothetical protein
MAVVLTQSVTEISTLRAGSALLTENFFVLISVRGSVSPRALVRLEALGKLK